MVGRQRRSFEDMLRGDDEDLDLARAALAVAQGEYPDLDPEAYVLRLDALAERVRARLRPGASPRVVVDAMNRCLFEEEGFRGNLEDYYDPQNSYLHRVLDRRLGIPITLSLVYLEVGRRLGLPMAGVGLPGHFVVKVAGAHEEILLDPFYRGATLDRAECQRRLDAIYGGKVVLTDQFLRAVGKREMLARLLYNLKRIHTRAGDTGRALRVLDQLLVLQPFALEDIRDRGLLRYRAERYAEALADLRQYLLFLPKASDAAEVRKAILACERLETMRK
jgi:regulator of sirC expression with transglutaminase-like and TPR domain